MAKIKYKRVVLKISGEVMMGTHKYGIDPQMVKFFAREIKEVYTLGVQLAVVVGGGNIWRGISPFAQEIDRVTADYMGMLATIINGLALQDSLEEIGIPTRVQTAIEVAKLAEPFIRRRAIRHLEKKRVVIFAGGTGNPYFTTDTASALRAMEIGAEIILKATKVDGVYDRDPEKYKNARKFDSITFIEAINRQLKVLDATALSLCWENKIPIMVFNINKKGQIKKAICGERVGTIIK
jgi:uridylate kinase